MKAMGIIHFDLFLKLSSQSIGSRFGKLGLTLYEHASGKQKLPWQSFQIQDQIKESLDLDEESQMDSLEPLLFVLKKLLDLISLRLKGRNLRVSRLLVELKLHSSYLLSSVTPTDQNILRAFDLRLPMAQGASLGILPILRQKLSVDFESHPLPSSVTQVNIQVLETSPGHCIQKNFFHSDDVLAEALDQLLGRLIAHLGTENVFYAQLVSSHCPEKAWSKTLSLNSSPTPPSLSLLASSSSQIGLQKTSDVCDAPHLKRPTRILQEPQWMEFKSFQLLRSQKKDWKIIYWIGPERLTTEWWVNAPNQKRVDRDYYQLITETHEKLWVFFDRTVHPTELFLHGYFD